MSKISKIFKTCVGAGIGIAALAMANGAMAQDAPDTEIQGYGTPAPAAQTYKAPVQNYEVEDDTSFEASALKKTNDYEPQEINARPQPLTIKCPPAFSSVYGNGTTTIGGVTKKDGVCYSTPKRNR